MTAISQGRGVNSSVVYGALPDLIGGAIPYSPPQNSNSFTNAVEKHLSDIRQGDRELSKDVSFKLANKERLSHDLFSKLDLRANSLYSAYSTGLSYDKKARFVKGVNETAVTISRLRNLFA